MSLFIFIFSKLRPNFCINSHFDCYKRNVQVAKTLKEKKRKKEPFLSCLVTYLLLLRNVKNIFLLWPKLGVQPCEERLCRHVGSISVCHSCWNRDLPVVWMHYWHHREVVSNISDTVKNPLHRQREAKPREEDLLPFVNHIEFSRTEIKGKLFFSVQWFSLLACNSDLAENFSNACQNISWFQFWQILPNP